MSGDFELLARRIERELEQLEQVVGRAESAIDEGRGAPQYQAAFIDSAALNLHDFYSGLERIFPQIALKVDEGLPEGREWHRELLQQMSLDIPPRRPPVLEESVVASLHEFLGFRHVVRSVYAYQFNPERIERLVADLRPVFEEASRQLRMFAELLLRIGRSS